MSSAVKWLGAAMVVALIAWVLWSALGNEPSGATVAPEEEQAGPSEPLPATQTTAFVEPAPTAGERVSAAESPDRATRAWLLVLIVGKGTAEPIEDMAVSATPIRETPAGPRILKEMDTDGAGRVELEVEPGVGLKVSVRDRRTGRENPVGQAHAEVEPLLPGERRELTVEVAVGRDLVFFGRVVDGISGRPIPGARAVEEQSGITRAADVGGLLELHLPSWRPGAFKLTADGYGGRRFVTAAGHERVEDARVLKLLPVATLKVTVRDAGTEPLDSLKVRLSARSYELNMPDEQLHISHSAYFGGGDGAWTARCASDGSCELTDLPSRVSFEVELLRDGELVLKPGSFGLEPGEVRELTWQLNAGVRVAGELRDQEGAPIAGCVLGRFPASVGPNTSVDRWLLAEHVYDEAVASTVSDTRGGFVFEDVAPGTWWIGTRPPEGDPNEVAALAVRVVVPPDVAEHVVLLSVERGLFVRGRVITPDGSAPKRAWVTATPEALGGFAQSLMEDGGTFELGPLAAGSYRLVARSFRAYADSHEVVVSAGDEGVVLELEAAGSLEGQVVDARDGGGLQAKLSYNAVGGSWKRGSTSTRPDGSFALMGLGEGTYDLAATSANGLVAFLRDVAVAPGGTSAGLRIELRPGARVEVRYKGTAGYCQYEVISGGALFGSDGLKTGATAVVFIPPGPVEVVFNLSGQPVETQRAELGVGDEQTFVFEPGG